MGKGRNPSYHGRASPVKAVLHKHIKKPDCLRYGTKLDKAKLLARKGMLRDLHNLHNGMSFSKAFLSRAISTGFQTSPWAQEKWYKLWVETLTGRVRTMCRHTTQSIAKARHRKVSWTKQILASEGGATAMELEVILDLLAP
eukprot:2654007-Amphidinium_carterae.1